MIVRWHLGDVVRKLRRVMGWTIADLERASGLNQSVLNRLERGKTKQASRHTEARLAAAFGLTARQLLDSVPPARELPLRKTGALVRESARRYDAESLEAVFSELDEAVKALPADRQQEGILLAQDVVRTATHLIGERARAPFAEPAPAGDTKSGRSRRPPAPGRRRPA